ncbi:GAF and ANTAR domain-containing protein [Rhodococcus sp. G-MC3]|uniref:GAF and ANTAR domain-containing protein n=1 Tax=Rhodococcus sp. G-MC3 TaxID=3046209 RepID=UPI0024B92529|nr:GAF and ANTAR domain-containing protein [Rhodococcus sp. G-MC3]MDJ0392907.1 GAF and ANTAR domain-containing protein [Rhodococcus sp. G-MC3]
MAHSTDDQGNDTPSEFADTIATAHYRRAHMLDPSGLDNVTSRLAVVVADGTMLIEVMNRAAVLVVGMLDEIAYAGITAAFDSAPFTIAPTDDRAIAIDAEQYRTGDGPCLRAVRTKRWVHLGLDQVKQLWPEIGRIAESAGIDRFVAAPLGRRDRTVGSLNLYCSESDDEQHAIGFETDVLSVVVDHLNIAVHAYGRDRELGEAALVLRQATADRATIDTALGVLMARENLGSTEARGVLHARARDSGTSVAQTAQRVLATGN